MDIRELKKAINDNNLPNETMIWVLEDGSSNIIATQYIKKICEMNGLTSKGIEFFDEIPDQSFIDDKNLYIMRKDEFNEVQNYPHCILLCKKSKDKRAIKIPKLEDWQVLDYLSIKVPGMKKEDLQWLITQYTDYCGGYFRMISDMDKIGIFPESIQSKIFNQMMDDDQFSDITSLNIWDLVNGIVRKDKKLVNECLRVIDYIDVEPTGLITNLYRNFKNVIMVQLNPNATAEDLGLTGKQYYAIKKNSCNHYSITQLIRIFKLITNMEHMYKYEGLKMENVIDYMTVKIMGE